MEVEEIKLLSHSTLSSLDSIKMAALYFDKINLSVFVNAAYYPQARDVKFIHQFKDPTFLDHLNPLINEKLLSLNWEHYSNLVHKGTTSTPKGPAKIFEFEDEIVNNIIITNSSIFYDPKSRQEVWSNLGDNTKMLSLAGESAEELKTLEEELGEDAKMQWFAFEYYGSLLKAALKGIDKGENILTASGILDEFLRAYFDGSHFTEAKKQIHLKLNIKPKIAFEAIKLNVPNISRLSFEDILELRLKMGDELLAFKSHLSNLQFDLEGNFEAEFIINKSKEVVNAKINPAIRDLTSKMEDISLGVATTILKEIKDPKSYSPLILTMTNDVSNTYAILISMGLISLNTAIELFKSKKELKKNGLYYLLKLNRKQ